MRYEVDNSGVPVLLVDSISEIIPEDANKIVVAGSHASQNVPRYALSIPLRGAVLTTRDSVKTKPESRHSAS
jgi:hypothetical protein